MFHLGKKIRIGNLKIVFAPVRPERVLQENSVDSRATDRFSDEFGMFFEKRMCIAQGPPVNARQWGRVLTIDGNGRNPGSLANATGSPAPFHIAQGAAVFNPAHPATHGGQMDGSEQGDAPRVDTPHAQGDDRGPLFEPPLEQGAAGKQCG